MRWEPRKPRSIRRRPGAPLRQMQWSDRWWTATTAAGGATPLLFSGGEVRVRAGGVIRDVYEAFDLGRVLAQHRLNALAERYVGHSAPLAAAPHAQHDHAVLDVNQL